MIAGPAGAAPTSSPLPPFRYSGRLEQGGCLIGKTDANAQTAVDGERLDRGLG